METLPNEVWAHIFSFCDYPALAKLYYCSSCSHVQSIVSTFRPPVGSEEISQLLQEAFQSGDKDLLQFLIHVVGFTLREVSRFHGSCLQQAFYQKQNDMIITLFYYIPTITNVIDNNATRMIELCVMANNVTGLKWLLILDIKKYMHGGTLLS